MKTKSDYQLARQAVRLFPQTSTADLATVQHARRKWLAAVAYLRDREISHWVMDHPVARTSHGPVHRKENDHVR